MTALLHYGNTPVAVAQHTLAGGYGYRNACGRTDFNFLTSDSMTFQQPNEAMGLQLYATATIGEHIFADGFQ